MRSGNRSTHQFFATLILVFSFVLGGGLALADDDTSPGDDDDSFPVTISGKAADMLTGANVAFAVVELMDGTSGTSFQPAITTTADINGNFSIQLPTGLTIGDIGLHGSQYGYYDSYMYHMDIFGTETVITGLSFWLFPTALIEEEASQMDVTLDAVDDGMLFGIAAWISGNNSGAVGCAQIGSDPVNVSSPPEAVYYMDNTYRPSPTMTGTGSNSGAFWIFNATPGATTVTAAADQDTASTGTFVYANSVTLNIIRFTDANQPSGQCPADLAGTVIDGATHQAAGGATIQLLDPASGLPFAPAISSTSASDGTFNLIVPPSIGLAGLEVTLAGHMPSYYWGPVNNLVATMGPLVTMPTDMIEGLEESLGVTPDPTKSIVVGSIGWTNGPQMQPVGCAQGTSQAATDTGPTGTAIYFDNQGNPSASRTSTNPGDGQFVIFGVDASDSTTASATVAAQVGADSASMSVPYLLAGGITWVTVTFAAPTYSSNPTPGTCNGDDDDDNDDDNDDDSAVDDDTTSSDDDDTALGGDDDSAASDDDALGDDDDSVSGDDDASPSGDDDDATPIVLSGRAADMFTGQGVAFAAIEILDGTTGASFAPPVTATADQYGNFSIAAPAGETLGGIGLRGEKTGYFTAYFFHMDFLGSSTPVNNLSLWIFPIALIEEEASSLGVTIDPVNDGMVFGVAGWVHNGNGSVVGCAHAATAPANLVSPAEAVYYLDSSYRSDANATATTAINGGFWAFNVSPGATTVNVAAGEATAAEGTFIYAGGVTISTVIFGGENPPTPNCPVNDAGSVIDGTTQTGLAGATIQLLDSNTGAPFDPAISTVSSQDGTFNLLVPASVGLAGVEVSLDGYLPSYYWGPVNNMISTMGPLMLMPTDAIAQFENSFNVAADSSKAIVIGSANWTNGPQQQTVGCALTTAQVSEDTGPSGTAVYFDGQGNPSYTGTGTNPGDGQFVVLGADAGTAATISAQLSGGTATTTVPYLFAGGVTWVTVTFGSPSFTSNPTPSGCAGYSVCGEQNACSNGCCDGDNNCRAGITDDACGSGGGQCAASPEDSGLVCNATTRTFGLWRDPATGYLWEAPSAGGMQYSTDISNHNGTRYNCDCLCNGVANYDCPGGGNPGCPEKGLYDHRRSCGCQINSSGSQPVTTRWGIPSISQLRSLIKGCAVTDWGGTCGVYDGCHDGDACWIDHEDDCKDGCPYTGLYYWPNVTQVQGGPFGAKQSCTYPDQYGCGLFWSASGTGQQNHVWRVDFAVATIDEYAFANGGIYALCVQGSPN